MMDKRSAWDLFWTYDRLSSFGTGMGAGGQSREESAPAGGDGLAVIAGAHSGAEGGQAVVGPEQIPGRTLVHHVRLRQARAIRRAS